MGGMLRNIDLSPAVSRRTTPMRFERPHFRNFVVAVAGSRTVLSNRITPVKAFMLQNDLDNADWLRIADATVSPLNGIMLDPGAAWFFAPSQDKVRVEQIVPTPANFAEKLAQQTPADADLFLDMHDFWIYNNAGNTNVIIFWSTITT